MAAGTVSGQEALRNALATQTAAPAQRSQAESQPYTVKAGDLRLLASSSLGIDWNDNVSSSKANSEQDFILRPLAQLQASYPLTQVNLFSLSISAGYQYYLQHDELSTWYLQSGSQLAFDFFIKDFWFNLHDQFSYTRNSGQEAAVANTSKYGNFNNTAGVSSRWDLRDVVLSLGYDHANVISGTQQFQSQDRTSEMIVGRAGLKVHPTLTAGVEATGSLTSYDEKILNDNLGYSAGVYADWQLGTYFRVQPRAGYASYYTKSTSQLIQAKDLNSWYIDLTLTHQVNDLVSYSLNAGHEIRLGVYSDFIEDSYFRPNITWNFIKDTPLTTSFFYEHGKQGASNFSGTVPETYDWYGGSLGLSRQITKKMTVSLNYRLTLRMSNAASRDYTQNVVGLQLSYRF